MQRRVRLGLIGASQIVQNRILPSVLGVDEIEVAAIAAERPGAAKELAERHQISKSYDSYAACLADPDLDAVYISCLNSDHASVIQQSLRAGKHVLCEKPITLSTKDTTACFELARDRGLLLLEGFMYRFHPQMTKLRQIVAAGQIGQIHSIRVNFSFILYDLAPVLRPKRASSVAGGGALNDLGCYGVDFIHWVLGDTTLIPQVESMSRQDPADSQFDLATSALLSYPNGVSATLECAVDTPALNNWEVSGTKGSISALRFDPQGKFEVPLYFVNEESEAQLTTCPWADTFTAELKNFARAILGIETPHILPSETIQNSRVIDLIRKKSLLS